MLKDINFIDFDLKHLRARYTQNSLNSTSY